jgi:hypothetical protein
MGPVQKSQTTSGLQGQAPNHPMLLRSKDVVVIDGEKGGRDPSGE